MSQYSLPSQEHMDFLWLIRKHEIDIALKYLPPTSKEQNLKLLELGAGTGQQAHYLSNLGYRVLALDVPSSSYKEARIFPITEYNGEEIPAADEEFDLIFSSNVLEHVVNIDKTLSETHRTLKYGGTAIHIIPSPKCRIWSFPAHYIWLSKRIWKKSGLGKFSKASAAPKIPNSTKDWLRTIFPFVHGERGNALTEIYYFSTIYWKSLFEKNGFTIEKIYDNGIFYTMSNAFGTSISVKNRKRLSKFLGSSCIIYIVKK